MVTIPEAARKLGVSFSTVRRQARTGELPVVRIGRSVRINLSKIRAVDNDTVAELASVARVGR